MADIQKENGHLQLANIIVEALAKTHLSSRETQIIFAVFRKTYGWNKKEDWISNRQLAEMTGIDEHHISETVKRLVKRNMITKNGKNISFQKDYEKWKSLPISVNSKKHKSLPISVNKFTERGKQSLPKGVYTKDNKDTITKDRNTNSVKLDLQRGWNIPKDISSRWAELFPDIKINIELEKMRHWLSIHKDKKQEYDEKGTYPIFIVNWLERAKAKMDKIEKSKNQNGYEQFMEKVMNDRR